MGFWFKGLFIVFNSSKNIFIKNGQFGKEGVNAVKSFKAIYNFENDRLTKFYNIEGDSFPEEYKTKSCHTLF